MLGLDINLEMIIGLQIAINNITLPNIITNFFIWKIKAYKLLHQIPIWFLLLCAGKVGLGLSYNMPYCFCSIKLCNCGSCGHNNVEFRLQSWYDKLCICCSRGCIITLIDFRLQIWYDTLCFCGSRGCIITLTLDYNLVII